MRVVEQKIPDVAAIAPFVGKEAMVRYRDKVDGIYLKGIDPARDVRVYRRYLVEGRFLEDGSGEPEAIIGRKLARKLGIQPGEKFVAFGVPVNTGHAGVVPQPRAMVLRIVGLFESGMSEYDDIYVYTTLSNAQKLFQVGDAILGFDVYLKDLNKSASIAGEIQALLGYPHYARTASQLYRNLFAWIELQKKPAPILLGLIIVVATVNIIGTLLMLVLEKVHGIGILKSIGASARDIRRIFLLKGLVISIIGVVLGNAIAYGLCFVQLVFKPLSLPSDIYFMSFVPVMMEPGDFIAVSCIVMVLSLSAAMLPARAAARLDPVTILRFS